MNAPERLIEPTPSATPLAPFYADAATYNPVDVIKRALAVIAAGHGTKHVSLRTIRPLLGPDGAPLMDRRGEYRREVHAGTFTDLRAAAEQAAELNRRGAHVYVHAQRTAVPVTDRMLMGNVATVGKGGIKAYAALVADIDPDDDGDAAVCLYLAGELRTVLVEFGVPPGATMIQQTGRGAYLWVAIEQRPSPLEDAATMRLALQTIVRLLKATGEPAHGDPAVHDPARILRCPGTLNHKREADPAMPAWILGDPWTPGVRAPFSIIEKLARKSQPKLRAVPAGLRRTETGPCIRRPLLDQFRGRGMVYGIRADGVADVRCPNATQHTDGRDGAILYPSSRPGGPGWLKCSHAHCADLTLFDVFRLLGRA